VGRLYSRSACARKNFYFFLAGGGGGQGFRATQVARGKPAPDLFLLAAEASDVAGYMRQLHRLA
jgi:hypothetical protein